MSCRLLVIDAHPLARRALVARLARVPAVAVVGAAEDEDQAVQLALHHQPTLIVLEPKLLEARRLVARLREAAPASVILIYTSYADLYEREILLGGGASGYLLKEVDLTTLYPWFAATPPDTAHNQPRSG